MVGHVCCVCSCTWVCYFASFKRELSFIFCVVFLILSVLRFDFYLIKKIETRIFILTFQILRFRTDHKANDYNILGLFEGAWWFQLPRFDIGLNIKDILLLHSELAPFWNRRRPLMLCTVWSSAWQSLALLDNFQLWSGFMLCEIVLVIVFFAQPQVPLWLFHLHRLTISNRISLEIAWEVLNYLPTEVTAASLQCCKWSFESHLFHVSDHENFRLGLSVFFMCPSTFV